MNLLNNLIESGMLTGTYLPKYQKWKEGRANANKKNIVYIWM